jgi:hypothetical protein
MFHIKIHCRRLENEGGNKKERKKVVIVGL